MNRVAGIPQTIAFIAVLIAIVCTSCNYPSAANVATQPPPTLQPTQAPTVLPTVPPTLQPTAIPHVMIPFNAIGKEQTIHDQVTKSYASQNRAYGGDEYPVGRFERPFDQAMKYQGYLDIVKSTMVRNDPNFIYIAIQVAEPVSSAQGNPAYFGLEMDLNLDGRSMYMIRGQTPQSEDWSVEGVDAWKSTAAEQPLTLASAGIPVTGALGFDVNLLKSGVGDDIDLAWIRLRPGAGDTVEIAFKNTIIGGEKGKFIWRPFTDGAPFSEREYDLQVFYSLEQAGSPYKDENFYPLKAVYAVDNTCRVASGFEATGREPGICPITSPDTPDSPDQPHDIPCVPSLTHVGGCR
jgi:hypothetical protein